MGATGWVYFVPYQQNIEKAMEGLQKEVMGRGEFIGAGDAPCDDADLLEFMFQNAADGTDGTHSILDIVGGVSETPNFLCASPVARSTLLRFFGTTEPTRQQVEAKEYELEEAVERWQAQYLVIYRDGKPHELCFLGSSGD